ncbi:MAG TPA: serine/threonine protein kinase, partial [Aeromonadales bacterium]|nr:serine/threonine protein kinase [Aeromonadales bacterium]
MSGSKHTGKQESSTGVLNSYENSSEETIDENHSELTVIQIRSVEPEVVDDKTRLSSEPDKTRIAIQTDNQIKNNVDSLNPIDKTVIKPFALSEQTRIQSQAIQPENSKEPEISTTDKKTVSIGSTIKNRFVLLEILGVGGMGKVYKALDLRKQEARDQLPYIAVKLLNDEFKHHPDALIALQREARKSQQLAHPNIVNVHDFDRDEEAVFMTMELLDGQSLEQIIAHEYPSGMPADIAVEIINSLCHALIYAHKHQIIHSDLKPANIFITAGGIPKIFDFGIARACNNSSLKSQAGVSDKTLFDPTALGALTPTYASLAMLEGRAPAESDDLYAICCVFYELLTGKHPYN